MVNAAQYNNQIGPVGYAYGNTVFANCQQQQYRMDKILLLPLMSIILTILNIGNGVWVVTANAQYETFFRTGFAYTSTDETATNWQLTYTQV